MLKAPPRIDIVDATRFVVVKMRKAQNASALRAATIAKPSTTNVNSPPRACRGFPRAKKILIIKIKCYVELGHL